MFAACVSMLTWFWAVPGLMSRSTFVALAVFLLGGTAVLLMAWRDVQAAGSTAQLLHDTDATTEAPRV